MNKVSSLPQSAAADVTTTATDGGFLRFTAGGVRFCADLGQVVRALFLPALQPVPGAAPYLVGLMGLGDASVPVIDLARRLGLTGAERYHLNTPILLCRHGKRRTGLVIDSVQGVAPQTAVDQRSDDLFRGSGLPYASVVRDDHGQILLLDLESLLGEDVMAGGPHGGRP
ncbi:MAG: chemotaxis protein CheW [Hyphomicrobiales bacterium]|nr:chemotaxis protein CheW [Hyphomicrobiales bacterium]MCP5370405.1 chemotaxis protein CheW [Hyphomicrobiales bacterium]